MKLKQLYSVAIIAFSFLLFSFGLPDKLKKKVTKEVKTTFDIKDFQLNELIINDTVQQKLSKRTNTNYLFKIEKDNEILGYAYVDKAPSKTDEFDYLILLNKNLIIAKTKILIYREDYGGEIGSKRWLKQFIGKKSSDKLQYEKDIIAISGATISALAMTNAVNSFLLDLDILYTNKVFNGV